MLPRSNPLRVVVLLVVVVRIAQKQGNSRQGHCAA